MSASEGYESDGEDADQADTTAIKAVMVLRLSRARADREGEATAVDPADMGCDDDLVSACNTVSTSRAGAPIT